MKKSLVILTSLALATATFCGGCGKKYTPAQSPAVQEPQQETSGEPVNFTPAGDPLMPGADQSSRATEIQMVEQMVTYRNSYLKELENLGKFYDHQGNHLKAVWVKQEQDALTAMEMKPYLVVAEIAGPDLKATEVIAEADAIYADALTLIEKGRRMLGDKKNLILAKNKLDSLLSTYPTSDKVDDAAWEIAQICNRDLKDYYVAMFYYQRVWQWNPENQYDARFAVARIYDQVFHNYPRACEFYELSIQLEPAFPANATYAKNRIKELNTKK